MAKGDQEIGEEVAVVVVVVVAEVELGDVVEMEEMEEEKMKPANQEVLEVKTKQMRNLTKARNIQGMARTEDQDVVEMEVVNVVVKEAVKKKTNNPDQWSKHKYMYIYSIFN